MIAARSVPGPSPLVDGAFKAWAIFVRDIRVDLSYGAGFWLLQLSIFVEVTTAYFISRVVGPSPNLALGNSVTYFDYLVINFAFVRFQSTALMSFALAIREGQMMGTLEAILVTPTSLPLIVLSSGLWAFAYTALQTIVYILCALIFGLDLHHTNLLTTASFLVLTIVAVSPLGVMAAAATMTFKKTGPVDWILKSAATLFGGVYLPVSQLPHSLQIISWLLPITHALNGFRGAVHGSSLAELAPDALWLAGAAVVLIPISLYVFGRAVHRSKVDGTLGQY